MSNDLKNRVRFTSTLDKKLLNELQILSKKTMVPMSKLLDKAIELLLEKHKEI